MATLKINGDTSGYVELVSPAVAGSTSIELDKILVSDSSGNVGIGLASPTHKLHVNGTVKVTGTQTFDVASGGGTYISINHSGNESWTWGAQSGSGSDDYLDVGIAGGTRAMSWHEDGNVGIGVTNTSVFNGVGGNSKLVVKGSDSSTNILNNSNASITIANDDGTASNTSALHFARADTDDNPHYAGASIVAQFVETQVTGQYPKGQLSFLTSTASNTAPSEKMRIDSSGNVGIGTNSPTAKLSVDQPSTTAISTTGGAAAGQIFTNEDFEFAFGLGNASPYPLYIQGRTSNPGISTPRNITLNPIGGNISIGTQSSIDRLNVETTSTQTHSTTLTKGTNTPGIWITNSNNDNNTSGLHLATGSGTHFSSIIGARTNNAAHWGTHLSFYTHDDNTSNINTATEKMRISGNGFVTTPNQPVVFVSRTSTQAVTTDSNAGTILDFTSTQYNIGGHFNISNNKFTAPITGRYEISWSYGTNVNGASVYRTFIWKNNNKLSYTQLRVDSNGHTGYVFGSRTAILELSANDYIELRASCDSGTDFYGDNELRIVMTIRLIG